MAQQSTIKGLPDSILSRVNKMLGMGDWTIDEVVEYLDDAGHPKSRSAVGRYKKNITAVAEKLRQSRHMADALVAELGDAATEGKHGRLLIEAARSMVFDFQMRVMEGKEDSLSPSQFNFLTKAISNLSGAMRMEQDFEDKLRASIAKEERQKAAVAVEEVASQNGLSKDQVALIRAEILGIEVDNG